MRSEQEIIELKEEMEELTSFIEEVGSDLEAKLSRKDLDFNHDISDALSWVLDEIPTDHFKSVNYMNMPGLREVAKKIEERTGKNLKNYQ